MAFERRGYLSPDIDLWVKKVRQEDVGHFQLADAVSDLGVRIINDLEGKPKTPQNMFLCAFHLRALQSLQGAILTAERGMYVEARTLLRGAIETLFYLAATLKDSQFTKRLGQHHVTVTNKLFDAQKDLLRQLAVLDPAADLEMETARAQVNGVGLEGKELQIREAAQKGGLDHVYQGFYRGLSTDASHPGLMALNSLWDRQGESGWSLQWGPEYYRAESLRDTLRLISLAGLMLIEHMNEFAKSDGVREEISKLAGDFNALPSDEEPEPKAA